MIGQRIVVYDYFMNKKRKSLKKKEGIIVGFYLNENWHPYTYKAYHVKFDDGTEDTLWAHSKKLVSNGYYK